MKTATYSIVIVELVSIIWNLNRSPNIIRLFGSMIGFAGVVVFGLAVWTMRDSWRAGIPESDKTEMVTNGIYTYSRNPAFLGFDMVYIGILMMFFHEVLLVFTIASMVMLHLQILQEEKFLQKVFGEKYLTYKNKVCRYIGRNVF